MRFKVYAVTLLAPAWCSTVVAIWLSIPHDSAELNLRCSSAINGLDSGLHNVKKLPGFQRLRAFDDALGMFTEATNVLVMLGDVSDSKEMRAAGYDCSKKINSFTLDKLWMNSALYKSLVKVTPLDSEQDRLKTRYLREFEENGINLLPEKFREFSNLKKALGDAESDYQKNVKDSNSNLVFSEEELKGVPTRYLANFKKNESGFYVVPVKRATSNQILENADSSETRRKMFVAYNNTASDKNVALLQEAVDLRQRLASLMGSKTWAQFRLQNHMLNTPSRVSQFLDEFEAPVEHATSVFVKKLEALNTSDVKPWDVPYLTIKLKNQLFHFDVDAATKYFPAETTVPKIMNLLGRVFGVTMARAHDVDRWSPLVQAYKVKDQKSQMLLGIIYLDLYPRPGRIEQPVDYALGDSRIDGSGQRTVPIMVDVENFPSASNGSGIQLGLSEISSLFHGMGHALNYVFMKSRYYGLSFNSQEMDFFEVPALVFEEMAASPSVLKEISNGIPDDVLDSLVKSNLFEGSRLATRLFILSGFDLQLHDSQSEINVSQLYSTLYQKAWGFALPETVHPEANFYHVMGGYDVNYYAYLLAKAYAVDLISVLISSSGELDKNAGLRFRKTILGELGIDNPAQKLESFLGRQPSVKPFLERLAKLGD